MACMYVGGEMESCGVQMGGRPVSWHNNLLFPTSNLSLQARNTTVSRRALCAGYCSGALENDLYILQFESREI